MTKPRCWRASCTPSCSAPTPKGGIRDLLWYLSDPTWPQPNLTLLNNALAQTNWQGETLTIANWRGQARDRLRLLDWENIQTDVRPFVEPGFDPGLLTLANLERVLVG